MATTSSAETTIRALAASDLDTVVALDASIEGRSRREYFARRLKLALAAPKEHVQIAAVDRGGLAGFMLARLLHGEFGRMSAALRLEAVGVREDARGAGVGGRMFDAVVDWARAHGAGEVRTQASWNQHEMLRWLDRVGFALAPACIVARAVGELQAEALDDDAPVREIGYGAQASGDFEPAARDLADVSSMRAQDIDDIVRIDRLHTGRERAAYVRSRLDETTADSSIGVSLTARVDGIVAGFVMARTDLGDFGRLEPVAVLDTIGVDPGFARRGVGRALMSQLLLNLSALRVERVETIVAPRDFGLLGFLYGVGFAPSQKLAFVRRVGAR